MNELHCCAMNKIMFNNKKLPTCKWWHGWSLKTWMKLITTAKLIYVRWMKEMMNYIQHGWICVCKIYHPTTIMVDNPY
jgi:hypothetical protein